VVRRLLNRRGARLDSVGAGDGPAEAGQLAGDGDGDDRAALGALRVEATPDAVQPLLGLPRDLDDVGALAVLAALERLAARRRLAVVPGGLDQQPRAWREPVLVIAPWRRVSPLELSDGTRPR
jgi:hypothetical protein